MKEFSKAFKVMSGICVAYELFDVFDHTVMKHFRKGIVKADKKLCKVENKKKKDLFDVEIKGFYKN